MAAKETTNGQPVTMGGVKAWLPLIITIAALLIGLGVFQGECERYFHQVDVNTVRLDRAEQQYTETQVKLARIETDLAYIRTAQDKLLQLHTQ